MEHQRPSPDPLLDYWRKKKPELFWAQVVLVLYAVALHRLRERSWENRAYL